MAKVKLKLSGDTLKFFQTVGRRGGKKRARKYSHKQMKAWARLGGRPGRSLQERADALERKFESAHAARIAAFKASTARFLASQAAKQERFERKHSTRQDKFEAKRTGPIGKEKFAAKQEFRQKRFIRMHAKRLERFARRQDRFNKLQSLLERKFQAKHAALLEKSAA